MTGLLKIHSFSGKHYNAKCKRNSDCPSLVEYHGTCVVQLRDPTADNTARGPCTQSAFATAIRDICVRFLNIRTDMSLYLEPANRSIHTLDGGVLVNNEKLCHDGRKLNPG